MKITIDIPDAILSDAIKCLDFHNYLINKWHTQSTKERDNMSTDEILKECDEVRQASCFNYLVEKVKMDNRIAALLIYGKDCGYEINLSYKADYFLGGLAYFKVTDIKDA